MSLNALIRSISCQQGDTWKRSSWRCVRRRCQRRVCGLQQSYIPVPPSLPGHGSARTSPRHRVHPHSATRRKAPRTRPSSPCPHSLPKHSSSGRDGASTPTSPCASSSHLLTTQLRQSSTCVGGGDSHRSLNTSTIGMHVKDSCTVENRGLNKRISESEASQPPARLAAAPCRRHHGIRRPRGRSNPRRVGGMHVFRRLDACLSQNIDACDRGGGESHRARRRQLRWSWRPATAPCSP